MTENNMMTADELIENFEFLDDWETRYSYLIELGKGLPVFDDALKNDQTLVKGCTSQVWMAPQETEKEDVFQFIADSDAHIVRGLIGVLMIVYNNKAPSDILSFDIQCYFDTLGLGGHLSPNRRNGFFSMVERIKTLSTRA